MQVRYDEGVANHIGRNPFLGRRACADRSADRPGLVHRTCAELQQQFFDPPLETRSGVGKYR